jgi:hypothetical protein
MEHCPRCIVHESNEAPINKAFMLLFYLQIMEDHEEDKLS